MTDENSVPFARLAALSGPVGAVLSLGAIALSTGISPTFSWTESALSDLGVGPGTAALFNVGLMVGAVVAAGYAAALRCSSRPVAAAYACTAVGLFGVGAFPLTSPLHFPAAVGFFVALVVTLALDGARRRETTEGRASLTLALLSAAAWPLWFLADLGSGIAVPELVGALSLALWVLVFAPPAPVAWRR